MSTLKPTKKISRRQELRQDTVVTFSEKILQFLDAKRPIVMGAGAAILVLVLAAFGFSYMQTQKQQAAAEAVAVAVRLYEKGDYRTALDGAPPNDGLLAVIDRYGSTGAGNLSRFYAADAHFRLGEYDEALKHFRAFDKSDDLIGASAYAGEAAIVHMKGEHAEAAALFERAADAFESDETTPRYLLEAARAYEAAGEFDEALEVCERIKDEYASTAAARDVDLVIARVRARARKT